MVEHRIGSIDGIDERDSIDLLARFNVIVRIEKMAAVQGHDVLRGKEAPNGRRTAISLQVRSAAMPERYGCTSMRCSGISTSVPDAYGRDASRRGDCAGYDDDETPDHDRNKHAANAPGKLCHHEGGDLDKDIEQHPRRIRTRREDAILFVLKRSLADRAPI